jgi:hypothetical protein
MITTTSNLIATNATITINTIQSLSADTVAISNVFIKQGTLSNVGTLRMTFSNLTGSNLLSSNITASNTYSFRFVTDFANIYNASVSNLYTSNSFTTTAYNTRTFNNNVYSSNSSNLNLAASNLYVKTLTYDTLNPPGVSTFIDITACNIHTIGFSTCNLIASNITASNAFIKRLRVEKLEILNALSQVLSNVLYIDVIDLDVRNNLTVSSNVFAPRYGVSGSPITLSNLPIAPDYTFKNIQVNETLGVTGIAAIGSSVSNVQLRVNGIIEATNFDATSDRRLKHNIVDISQKNALENIKKLNPVTYQYKHKHCDQQKYGFIAQEIGNVLPHVVYESENYNILIQRPLTFVSNNSFELKNHNLSPGDSISIRVQCNEQDVITKHIVDRINLENFSVHPDIKSTCNKKYSLEQISYSNVKHIDYNQLIPLLIGSIKELSEKVDRLEKP